MISEEQLDKYRQEGTLLRVVRDASPENDIRGIVVAWDDESVVIRKRNKNMVKLKRSYHFQPYSEERNTDWLGI